MGVTVDTTGQHLSNKLTYLETCASYDLVYYLTITSVESLMAANCHVFMSIFMGLFVVFYSSFLNDFFFQNQNVSLLVIAFLKDFHLTS